MSSRIITRNPLAYPAGAKPGFDPNHIAGKEPRWSGISRSGGNMQGLLDGKFCSIASGTPGYAINNFVGPATVFASGDSLQPTPVGGIAGRYVGSGGPGTMACIYMPTAFNANGNHLLSNYPTLQSVAFYLDASGLVNSFYANTVGQCASTITVSLNTPYFLVATWITGLTRWGVVNLKTGQIRFDFNALAAQNAISPTALEIGNPIYSAAPTGHYAVAMWSEAFIGQQGLAKWCASPWSYWFPDV